LYVIIVAMLCYVTRTVILICVERARYRTKITGIRERSEFKLYSECILDILIIDCELYVDSVVFSGYFISFTV